MSLSPTLPAPSIRSALSARRAALGDESGFTMIELTIVVLIVGILISITVPAYLGLQARAQQGAAMSTVRASVSGVESFYADNGSFTGISPTVLKTYDSTLDTSSIQVIATSGGNSYMMCSKNGPYYGYKLGPAASVLSDTTAPTGCTL